MDVVFTCQICRSILGDPEMFFLHGCFIPYENIDDALACTDDNEVFVKPEFFNGAEEWLENEEIEDSSSTDDTSPMLPDDSELVDDKDDASDQCEDSDLWNIAMKESSKSVEKKKEKKILWPVKACLFLLDHHFKALQKDMTKNQMYQAISIIMKGKKSEDFNYSPDQVKHKIQAFEKTFKALKDNKSGNKSGRGRLAIPYESLLIRNFSKQPHIIPPVLVGANYVLDRNEKSNADENIAKSNTAISGGKSSTITSGYLSDDNSLGDGFTKNANNDENIDLQQGKLGGPVTFNTTLKKDQPSFKSDEPPSREILRKIDNRTSNHGAVGKIFEGKPPSYPNSTVEPRPSTSQMDEFGGKSEKKRFKPHHGQTLYQKPRPAQAIREEQEQEKLRIQASFLDAYKERTEFIKKRFGVKSDNQN